MIDITSLQNPKVKEALSLREPRDRRKANLFLIEGFRELSRAVQARWEITSLFFAPDFFLGENEEALIASIDAPKYRCSKAVFQKLSYRDRPDGLLGVAKQIHPTLDLLPKKKKPLYIVTEGIEKPGNLGTILRSADAAGVDGLIVTDPTTDLYNPNVVRASVGTLFTVPFAFATPEEMLDYCAREKITLVAATPHASLEYTEADLRGAIAIAVGSEQYGLSDLFLQRGLPVKIPMLGVADSLNVATATTLLLYEAVRQRRDRL